MVSSQFFRPLWIAALLSACSGGGSASSAVDAGTGAAGGAGGASGAGVGGSAGVGASAGSSGNAGTGGDAGTAGTGGEAGAAGAAGAAGGGGAGGSGGSCPNVDCVGVCCAAGQVCTAGKCCTPSCGAKQCGADPVCGASCGGCSVGVCDAGAGACTSACTPTAPILLARPYRPRRAGLVLDHGGNAHVVHWGDNDAGQADAYRVFHATNAGGAFQRTFFDTIDQWGADVYLGIDQTGGLHAGYAPVSAAGGPLRYAQNLTGTWNFQWPKLSGTVLRFAAGADGKVHFISKTSSGWSYETNASGQWVSEAITTDGTSCELRIDAQGKAHIACIGGFIDYELRLLSNVSGSFQSAKGPAIAKGSKLFGLDLAVDGAGMLHVVYVSGGGISYATNAAGAWTSEELDAAGDPYPSVDVSSTGKVYVTFPSGGKLRHGSNQSGSWIFKDVDTVAKETRSVTRVDAIGRAHVVYGTPGSGAELLKYVALCP